MITASLAGAAVFPDGGAYGPSKHAVVALARHASMALTGTPVSVHLLCPALVRTGMSGEGVEPAEVARHALELIGTGRFAWVPLQWHDAVGLNSAELAAGEAPSAPRPDPES